MKPFWPALPRMIRTRNTGRRRTDRRTKQMRVVNKFRLSTLCGQSDRGEIRHALIGGLSNCGERFMPESRLQSGVSAVLRKIRNPAAERFCGGVSCFIPGYSLNSQILIMLLIRESSMKCGRRRFQPLLRYLHPGNGAVWVIYSQIYPSRHTKRTLTSHIIKADKMATVLRGGNIGEEPFF